MLSPQGAQVWSLVRELRSCMLYQKQNKMKKFYSRAVPWWPSVRMLGFHCSYLGSVPGGRNWDPVSCVVWEKKNAIPDLPAKAHPYISTGLGDEEMLPSETQERGGKLTHVTQPVSDQGEKRPVAWVPAQSPQPRAGWSAFVLSQWGQYPSLLS